MGVTEMRSWRRTPIEGTNIQVADWGAGEPIIFVQTALTADELLPLAGESVLADGYRKVVYHRPGYAGSDAVDGSRSIKRDATECRQLLENLGIATAHVVGFSYSGAVGLQLATDAPDSVQTLTLLEPPPVHTPSNEEFRAANDRLAKSRAEIGPAAALDEFLTTVVGSHWRSVVERLLPGSAVQMEQDVATFFDHDLPALLEWRFSPKDARLIECPTLHIGGDASGPLFAEVRQLMLEWLPSTEDVVIEGATHSLALTHTSAVADALANFLRRHPIKAVPSTNRRPAD